MTLKYVKIGKLWPCFDLSLRNVLKFPFIDNLAHIRAKKVAFCEYSNEIELNEFKL